MQRDAAGRPEQLVEKTVGESFVGGVIIVPAKQLYQCHGYNNDFWVWGYEDIELVRRLQYSGYPMYREEKGCFHLLPHPHHLLDKPGKPQAWDGLSKKTIVEVNHYLNSISLGGDFTGRHDLSNMQSPILLEDNDRGSHRHLLFSLRPFWCPQKILATSLTCKTQ